MIPAQSTLVILSAHSYVLGDLFSCRFTVSSNVNLSRVRNVSVDMLRLDRLRDQFAFGFGSTPRIVEQSLEIEQNLSAGMTPGLYRIARVTLSVDGDGEDVDPQQFSVTFPPTVIFQIRSAIEIPASPETIAKRAEAIIFRRSLLARKPHIVSPLEESDEGLRFLVRVFGVGCLIHQSQQLEGFSIFPLGVGLSHRDMWEIVNGFLESDGSEPLPFIETTEQSFQASTPIFVISYEQVVADNVDAAFKYCAQHAQRVFSILGIDRGQKPRAFAYVVAQYDTNRWWHEFVFPGYRGNFAVDFNPVETGNLIERLLPRLETSPFSRLIVATYADATAEPEYGFAVLRFWSVMELVAEHSIPGGKPVHHPDGSPILKANGKAETTNSKHGRVYEYILAGGTYEMFGNYVEEGVQKTLYIGGSTSTSAQSATEAIALWDMVRAVYAVRNSIAHEGQFDIAKAQAGDEYERLAVRLMTGAQGVTPLEYIKWQARRAIWREV